MISFDDLKKEYQYSYCLFLPKSVGFFNRVNSLTIKTDNRTYLLLLLLQHNVPGLRHVYHLPNSTTKSTVEGLYLNLIKSDIDELVSLSLTIPFCDFFTLPYIQSFEVIERFWGYRHSNFQTAQEAIECLKNSLDELDPHTCFFPWGAMPWKISPWTTFQRLFAAIKRKITTYRG